jgi:hypothetical protein
MIEPIATPIGLFKAGFSGAGGQYEPMDENGLRRDIFMRTNVIFGLMINTSVGAPTRKSMIIDFIYDDFCIRDPHASKPMIFSTDYPAQTDRGFWYGFCQVPGYSKYCRVGTHKVTIKVAPRQAPAAGTTSAHQILPPRDFSPEAGGVSETFEFKIYPASQPLPVNPDLEE